MTVTVDEFLTSVKRLVTMPANQVLLQNSDMLAFGDRKMRDTMIPLMDGINQDFYVTISTVPIVNGVADYRIPSRSFGRKLRDLKLVDPSGGKSDFPLIAIERQQLYVPTGSPWGFHFMGDRVRVVPQPNTNSQFSLEMWWFLGPGKMILGSDAGLVTGITGNDVTLSSVPPTFISNVVVDFIQGTSGCTYLSIDQTITNVAGNTLSFASGAVPTDLAVGDWVSLKGYSPVLQIPDEASPFLETLVGMEVLGAVGDYEGMERLKPEATEQKKNLLMLLEPRIEGEPQVIINDYGFKRRGWRTLGSGWGFY